VSRIATLALIVVCFCGTALCQYSAEFSSYYSAKRYDFRITPDQLTSTRVWLDAEPNPPLSARSATDIAAVYLSDLFSDCSTWRVGEIALHPVAERWVYLIFFNPRFRPDAQTVCRAPSRLWC
jgi:hypothetical protein